MIRTGYLPLRMIQKRTVLIVLAVALVTGLIVRFGMRTRHPLLDIDGIAHGTLENSESDVTLLFFLGTMCPISPRNMLQRLSTSVKTTNPKERLVFWYFLSLRPLQPT